MKNTNMPETVPEKGNIHTAFDSQSKLIDILRGKIGVLENALSWILKEPCSADKEEEQQQVPIERNECGLSCALIQNNNELSNTLFRLSELINRIDI